MQGKAALPLILAGILVAGCTELGSLASLVPTSSESVNETEPAPASTPTEEPTPLVVFACDLVSLADVQSLSPFHTPFAEAMPEVTACRYVASIDPPAPRAPVVVLEIWDYVTQEQSLAGVRSLRDNLNYDHPGAATELAGLGDEAYQYGEPPKMGDRVIVIAASGRYNAEAELVGEYKDARGPDVGFDAKVSAGAELLRLVFSRLP